MYRGRPPQRGGYPLQFEGRETRPYPPGKYGADRSGSKPPYQHERYGHVDSYRRSPPHRRYPSPKAASPLRHEWSGGQRREGSPSARRPLPHDHNLVITVGNELNAQPGSAPTSSHDRGFPVRPECEGSRARSPVHSRARSRGRSKSRQRSRSHSPNRSRAKSRGRSRSQHRSQSPHQDRSRAKSRGRSKSRHRSRSRTADRGQSRSRARSHRASMSRSKSRSWSRSRSRSRSRGRSKGFSRAGSRGRSKSRHRSRSSSSSSSSSGSGTHKKYFKELETARRRKEMEEMLSQPTKSILKKRNDSEDSPSIKSTDSPRTLDSSNMSRLADQLMQAMKGMEPHMMASVLSELRSDPQMAQRPGFDAEIKEILNLMGGAGAKPQVKPVDDIDDEEKFLYGDSEEAKPQPLPEPAVHHGSLDVFGTVTEDNLYGEYSTAQAPYEQTYSHPQGVLTHHQAPAALAESDVRYVSQPSSGLKQKIVVQVANSTSATDSEGQMEYDKIQELLKTIGLDLGVTEISKIAARTKERLHGNKPPKTPTRRRQFSSDSSEGSGNRRRRSRSISSSSSSSSSSRSRSRGRNKKGGSWSSKDGPKKLSITRSIKDTSETKAEQPAAVPPTLKDQQQTTSDPMGYPPHPGVTVPSYPPPQTHGIMPPNYPPPGYGQYGTYMPYMAQQQWPPMYPPHNMSLPPATGPDIHPSTQPYYSRGPESGIKGSVKTSAQNSEKNEAKLSSHEQKASDEQNNESQRQKVLEEREKLKQEREIRMKKKEYLIKELEQLRKQQGELLRKKRREKEGHKDPLLQEISRLQEDVMTQISNLRKEHEAAERKRSEIEKVALILGLNPSDRPRKASKPAEDQKTEFLPPAKNHEERSPERQQSSNSTKLKIPEAFADLPAADKKKPPVEESPATPEPFEYYDAGNHWCKNCNVTSGSMFDFFTHLHSKTHRKTLDPYNRPWASTPTEVNKNPSTEEKMTKPAKGSEFLLPVRGFFCLLCREFYGDAICAEEHVTTHTHNEKYKKQMYENPLYEQRRNLDRQAGLTVDASGKKRKHEDDEKGSKDKEEKTKHKKEKKDKEKKKDDNDNEEKIRVKTEEVEKEDKAKHSKKEDERPSYSNKEKDESYKGSKKDDKYSYKQQDEERSDRHRHSKHDDSHFRYHKSSDNKYDQSKYTNEDSYKYGKRYDFKSRYDRERDERAGFKKTEPTKPVGKSEVNNPEAPPRPCEPPKIFCGPSPAMRAKLRKQNLEAGKPAPPSLPMTFGKFTWKKKENILAKEAEKIAADFVKEDEEAAKASVKVSLAKTMAVAKEIAEKLCQPTQPDLTGNQEMIRPSPPVTNRFISQTNTMNKPAAPNTSPSIRSNTVQEQTPQLNKPLIAQNNQWGGKPRQTVSKPVPLEATPPPVVSSPKPPESRPKLPEYRPTPLDIKPPPPKQIFTEKKPALVSDTKPPPVVAASAVPKSKPEQSKMLDLMPDVLAPGVPESEQTHTVYVKPPPFLTMSEKIYKPEKLKSNLAAAKAQDLFEIFYNSRSQAGLSITKPNSKVDKSTIGLRTTSSLPSLEATKSPPQPPAQTQSQPQPVVDACPKETPKACLPSQQIQPESGIQIPSVCRPPPDGAPSEISPSLQSTMISQSKAEIQKSPQPKLISEAELLSSPQSDLAKPDPVSRPQADSTALSEQKQNVLSHSECDPLVTPEPESKPGLKTRGKRTPPAPHPVRQTRYQTRRQQVQSSVEPEHEPSSGDSDPAASNPKEVDSSNIVLGSQSVELATSEEDPALMEITPETLGLPSDMTALDFEFDFNFV